MTSRVRGLAVHAPATRGGARAPAPRTARRVFHLTAHGILPLPCAREYSRSAASRARRGLPRVGTRGTSLGFRRPRSPPQGPARRCDPLPVSSDAPAPVSLAGLPLRARRRRPPSRTRVPRRRVPPLPRARYHHTQCNRNSDNTFLVEGPDPAAKTAGRGRVCQAFCLLTFCSVPRRGRPQVAPSAAPHPSRLLPAPPLPPAFRRCVPRCPRVRVWRPWWRPVRR